MEEATVPSINTAAVEKVLNVLGPAVDHHIADLVPAGRGQVLDAYLLTTVQSGKGAGM